MLDWMGQLLLHGESSAAAVSGVPSAAAASPSQHSSWAARMLPLQGWCLGTSPQQQTSCWMGLQWPRGGGGSGGGHIQYKTLPGRLELPTLRLTASRSSQLS